MYAVFFFAGLPTFFLIYIYIRAFFDDLHRCYSNQKSEKEITDTIQSSQPLIENCCKKEDSSSRGGEIKKKGFYIVCVCVCERDKEEEEEEIGEIGDVAIVLQASGEVFREERRRRWTHVAYGLETAFFW